MLHSNTLKVNTAGDLLYISFPNLDNAGAISAFTTRMGGLSRGRYASMNMSFTNGDLNESVHKNYKILFSALGLDENKAVLSHQTHTDNIRIVTQRDIGKGITKPRDYENVDGLITDIPGIALVTQYADCVPLLFFDPQKKVAAASHGGWRGTVAQIAEKTVNTMCSFYNCNPKNILAAIGPSIGRCCYEVDDKVIEKVNCIDYLNLKDCYIKKANGKYNLSLQQTNLQIMLHAGIKRENICISDLCTCCHSEYFHSHRATGGSRGNLAAVIAIK